MSDLLPIEVVQELNRDAVHWNIKPVGAKYGQVHFYVGGEVLPFRSKTNERRQRGKKLFIGVPCADAVAALRSGLVALREAEV